MSYSKRILLRKTAKTKQCLSYFTGIVLLHITGSHYGTCKRLLITCLSQAQQRAFLPVTNTNVIRGPRKRGYVYEKKSHGPAPDATSIGLERFQVSSVQGKKGEEERCVNSDPPQNSQDQLRRCSAEGRKVPQAYAKETIFCPFMAAGGASRVLLPQNA